MQPGTPGRPVFPDLKQDEDFKRILDREQAARERAWKLASSINKDMGEFDDTDDTFFKITDPEKDANAKLSLPCL